MKKKKLNRAKNYLKTRAASLNPRIENGRLVIQPIEGDMLTVVVSKKDVRYFAAEEILQERARSF